MRRHLIYAYFVESTGIVEVFRALFDSYLKSDEFLKLNRRDDLLLIELLKDTIREVYAKSASTIAPDPAQLRLAAYWRLFGYEIQMKPNFPKTANYNADFNKNFEDAMYEIFQGILDQNQQILKLGNPAAVAELLNNLRRQLVNRTYNEIEDVAESSALLMARLLGLLDNNRLIVERLGIRADTRERRLLELGEKLRVPVAKQTPYVFIFAQRMETFLKRVEDAVWTRANAEQLYTNPAEVQFFREIAIAWYQVTGKDFQAEALKARQTARTAAATM